MLDPETIKALARDRTVIVATHDTPTMLAADRVYRLENGRVTEEDTHEVFVRPEA